MPPKETFFNPAFPADGSCELEVGEAGVGDAAGAAGGASSTTVPPEAAGLWRGISPSGRPPSTAVVQNEKKRAAPFFQEAARQRWSLQTGKPRQKTGKLEMVAVTQLLNFDLAAGPDIP